MGVPKVPSGVGTGQASRLQSLTDWANRSTTYDYFADGSVKAANNFNGTETEYLYDKALRLTDVWNKQATNTISRHTYTMDKVGNRTQAMPDLLARLPPRSRW